MTRRVTAPASTMSGTPGRRDPTARSPTCRTNPRPSGCGRRPVAILGDRRKRKRRSLFIVSSDLAELRESFDQPKRNALEPAGQESDAGRNEEDPNRVLDPAELLTQMERRAHERADRGGGEDEGQTQPKAVDSKQ